PFAGQTLETGVTEPAPVLPKVMEITATEAAHWLNDGAAAVYIGSSADFRRAHPEGAVWAIRPRLNRLSAGVLQASRIVVFADDQAIGILAAADLAEIAAGPVALVQDGVDAWRAAGRGQEASPGDPPDEERIDYLFWNH